MFISIDVYIHINIFNISLKKCSFTFQIDSQHKWYFLEQNNPHFLSPPQDYLLFATPAHTIEATSVSRKNSYLHVKHAGIRQLYASKICIAAVAIVDLCYHIMLI